MKHTPFYFFLLLIPSLFAQPGTNGDSRTEEGRPVVKYELLIEKNTITMGGVTSKHAMTVNGSVPGPTLEFTEGDLAIITVTNKMSVETSVHWHGLILPNFYDGVPYLTTPPIRPGESFEYRIPLNQSGTYWYHSHTMLQEQRGVYGSIVIHPEDKKKNYDRDLVVMFSDWTHENPMSIVKNLKRGNEWYQVKKKTAVPFARSLTHGAAGAQLKMWRDRMEGADIADIYYPTFLTNGQQTATYDDLHPGETVRLRFINASASSYFWLNFGDMEATLIAADGVDVMPVKKSRLLMAIAETYDFLVTIPTHQVEITATVQDGSGRTHLHLGKGQLKRTPHISRPDKIEIMKSMAQMNMKMGAPAIVSNQKKYTPQYLSDKYGMQMNHMDMYMPGDMDMKNQMDMPTSMPAEMHRDSMTHHNHHQMNMPEQHKMPMDSSMQMTAMDHEQSHRFDYEERKTYFNYDFLMSPEQTTFDTTKQTREILLNLTGNMNRYIWSLNGIPLSETDNIKIKSGEITRITLNNLTMMHHPMHIHGHYFRLINAGGEKSPLKHTVNVAPMQKVTIEFANEEEGDWFFHCHVLYHMMSGMTRVFSYDTPRDPRMAKYPAKMIIDETNRYYTWGTADISSNFMEFSLQTSNFRNDWMAQGELNPNVSFDGEIQYNRYHNDWLRYYGGVRLQAEDEKGWRDVNVVGMIGLKYFTPYMFELDLSVDSQLRPRLQLSRELLLFTRFFIEGEFDYQTDFYWINEKPIGGNAISTDLEWLVRGSYMLSKNFSAQVNYHSEFDWGGGFTWRF